MARPTPKQLHLFVNKRPVKDSLLNKVIKDACYGHLADGYYPFVVLFLDLHPSMVDVNVHPTKREVRFRNAQEVTSLLQETIKEAVAASENKTTTSRVVNYSEKIAPDELFSSDEKNYFQEQQFSLLSPPGDKLPQKGYFASLSVLCQIAQTYIVCKDGDGLVLIDFHAAHERILYNSLKERKYPLPSQNLLTPITFTIFPEDIENIENNRKILQKFGYDVDIIDKRTAIIRTVPAMAKYTDHHSVVQDLLKIISDSQKESEIIDSFISSVACHRALRAGKSLNHAEIVWLLNEMDKQSSIRTCPHGRPVWIKLTDTDLAKLFKRN